MDVVLSISSQTVPKVQIRGKSAHHVSYNLIPAEDSPCVVWQSRASPANRRPPLIYGISSCRGSVEEKCKKVSFYTDFLKRQIYNQHIKKGKRLLLHCHANFFLHLLFPRRPWSGLQQYCYRAVTSTTIQSTYEARKTQAKLENG